MKRKISFADLSHVTLFLGILFAVLVINIFKPADVISFSERRKLAQFPEISIPAVLSKESMDGFDNYSVDQIAFRERYRRLKAVFDTKVWFKSDNNAIFVVGDQVFKTEYPTNFNSARRLCDVLNYVYDTLPAGIEARCAFVPDKNYYLGETRHLVMDYKELSAFVYTCLRDGIEEIDLFDKLTLDCFYMTDSHWRQDRIGAVVDAIYESFGSAASFDSGIYTTEVFSPFYGVYYGQSALNVKPDDLLYLESSFTKNAAVSSIEQPGVELCVYAEDQLGGVDSYSLFMQGPQAIIRAENPQEPSGRELVIFRDSYASSLAPLLLPGYSAVTLVDLRYIRPDLLGAFIEFTDQDVLFLYSATLFNNSDSIKSPPQEEFISPFVARSVIG